ncbi:endonuclease/exonuclease/phosphatase family protein [Actinoplanes sp. NPDC049681]|uniref:endonuclease/exonuclease/phosphatase family protein n=1 Tax=Actinoplanes sp. NPDC049681 TaxID=3363905 RepID=UPI0037B87AB8
MRTALIVVLLVATALVYALMLLRLLRPERYAFLVCAAAVADWCILTAAPLAVAAALLRQPALVVALTVPAVIQTGRLVEMLARNRRRAEPVAGSRLRLVTANVLLTNPAMEALARDLAALDADVCCLQEITDEHLAAIKAAGLLDAYPHTVLDPRPGYHGSVILSRIPLEQAGQIEVGGGPMTQADLRLPGGVIRLVNVHTEAPLNRVKLAAWRRQLRELAGFTAPPGAELVLAGDFNATADHRSMTALLRPLRDAFDDAGPGLGATWPRWRRPMPALLRLDHVLISPGLAVRAARAEVSTGSDHRRLVVDLAPGGRAV